MIVGYTKGDLDGNHAGNTSDDLFVAKVDPNGNREWTTQVGTTAADRGYGLAIDPAGAIYAGGYTKGALGGPLVGDKDVILLKLAATGGAPLWIDQFGTIGEDKGMAVAAGGGVRLRRRHGRRHARHTGARHDAGRRRRLPRAGRRKRHADVDAPARHVRRRAALGRRSRRRRQRHGHRLHLRDLFATNAGDKDVVVARFDPAGSMTLHDQLGTIGNDKGSNGGARRRRQHLRRRGSPTATSRRTSATSTHC